MSGLNASLRFAERAAVMWLVLPLPLLAMPFWDWPVPDWSLLAFAVIGYAAMFWLGCLVMRGFIRNAPADTRGDLRSPNFYRSKFLIVVAAIVLNLATLAFRMTFNPLGCADLLTCTADAYTAYIDYSSSGSPIEYVRIFASPIIYGALGLSMWGLVIEDRDKLTAWYLMLIGTEVLLALITGTSRNFANLILFGVALRALKPFIRPSHGRAGVRALLMWATASVALISYFAASQLAREGFIAASGLLPLGNGYVMALSAQTGSESFVLKALESIVRYMCSGYFGFSLTFDLEQGLTFPFGNSMFLSRRASDLFNDPGYVTLTMPSQAEAVYGWSRDIMWSSIYPWLISDFSYAGTAVLMLVFGMLWILAVAAAITRTGPLHKLPVYLMFLMVLYIPSNNQLGQAPETAFAFIAAFMLMLATLPGLVAGRDRLPATAALP